MKLRIGPELQRQLAIVKLHGFSAADAVERAARRWERLGKPDLSGVETGTTYGGTVVTIEPPAGMDADTIRRLLAWYFAAWPAKPPRKRGNNLIMGVDYNVKPQVLRRLFKL